MTEARVEPIAPDPWLAAEALDNARSFAADGANSALTAASRQMLLQQAAIRACDALLAIYGRRVVGSDGGHALRLVEARASLAGEHDDLFERLDEGRASRNQASYRGGFVAEEDVEAMTGAVCDLVALVTERVRPELPDWYVDSREEVDTD
jgi:hypothetical protein